MTLNYDAIVRGPEGKNAPDAALLLKLSQYDSALIADSTD